MRKPDFSGWATKADLKCSDGRTIKPDAFKHMDGMTVPLVWQHGHGSTDNVLGHAVLEARPEGVYAYGYFNETKQGKDSKILVQHGDIKKLSIFANQLVERAKSVFHGMIREVSLVLAGANPGAEIDAVAHGMIFESVQLAHADGYIQDVEDAFVIHTNIDFDFVLDTIMHADVEPENDDEDDEDDETIEHADTDTAEQTRQSVKAKYDAFDDDTKRVVHYMLGVALESAEPDKTPTAEHSETTAPDTDTETTEGALAHQEGTDNTVKHNIFETGAATGSAIDHSSGAGDKRTLTHDEMRSIVKAAQSGGSFKAALDSFALAHGIENVEVLFPDYQNITGKPELNARRTEWVESVLNGTMKTPFAKVKTLMADITQDEARARGYIKGAYKEEAWISITRRVTSPTTVYIKKTMDRDDVVDITDFDVIMWLKSILRGQLREEAARAILIGDGRGAGHPDKVKDPIGATEGAGIRSILFDDEAYVTTVNVNVAANDATYDDVIDSVMNGFEHYKGSGTPTFYTTIKELNKFLQAKDGDGRRLYRNKSEVAQALGVAEIVTVEPMGDVADLIGIIVNLDDYNIGTDQGGEVNLFDDFDLDYNRMKYLMETRFSGALAHLKSALVIKKVTGTKVAPQEPLFNSTTGVVTIPSQTGVIYKNATTSATLTAGAQSALAAGATLKVQAVADTGYFFETNAEDFWPFKRPAAS